MDIILSFIWGIFISTLSSFIYCKMAARKINEKEIEKLKEEIEKLKEENEELERRATPIVINGLDPLKRKLAEYKPTEDEYYLYNSIFDMISEVNEEIIRY